MLMTFEKPKDKGKIQNCIGIVLDLVDISDEVAVGTTDRVGKVRIVCRIPEEERGDARDTESRAMRWRGRRRALQGCVFGEGRFFGYKLRTSEYVVVSDGESFAARTIKIMPEEDRWSELEKILDVRVLPWDHLGRPRAEAVRPVGDRDWEDKAAEAQLRPPSAGSGHARRVCLKHCDFIEHSLSESCPGCRAMKLGLRAQGRSPACWARMEDALGRTDSGKGRLDIAVDRTKEVIGGRATKRAMLSCSKLGVGEAPPSPMSSGGGASCSSNTSGSASSGMAVEETVDLGGKTSQVGPSALRR